MVERIRELCEKKNLTIQKLEIAAGLSNGSISKWEKSDPKVGSLSAVASILGVSMEYLMYGEERQPAASGELFENMLIHGEQKQPAGFGELSEDEIKLLAAYRKILDQKKPGYLDMLERAAEHKE